jgi:hypothetical protein
MGTPTPLSGVGSNHVTQGDTSGWLDIGTHLLRYRYANSKTQYVSNPSPLHTIESLPRGSSNGSAALSGTGSFYTFSGVVKSADPKVDRIIFEMTDAGGGAYYQATVLANSSWHSVAFRTKDADLRANPLFWDEFGHDVPTVFAFLEPFRGRLWGVGQYVYTAGQARVIGTAVSVQGSGTTWKSAAKGRIMLLSGGTRRFIESVQNSSTIILQSAHASASLRNYKIISETPDVLRFSKALFPESWPNQNSIRVLDGKPEKAKSIKGWRRDLIILGERSMERLVFTDDPFLDGNLEPVEGERGAASRRVVQDVEDALFALDYKGLHRFVGGTPEHIAPGLDPLFDPGDNTHGYVDFSFRKTFHSVHYPNRHQILWFVVINGEPDDSTTYSKPHHAISYDYQNGIVAVLKFDVAVVASTVTPGADGTSQTVLADENGRLWVFGIGNTDGVHSSSAKSFTVKSGTTKSNILVSAATLYASGSRLDGAYAHWVEGNQTKIIMSNSASGMLLASADAYSSAPSVGDTITLGRIYSMWKSKAFFFESPMNRRADGRYLHLFYEPKSSGEIRIRFYLDRSSTAYDDYSESTSNGGIAQDPDNNYYTVDLTTTSGYARVPLPSDGSHTVEFEIEIVDSATSFEMTGFEIDAASEEEDIDS